MMTVENTRKLPKAMLVDLYRTAETLWSDDRQALTKVQWRLEDLRNPSHGGAVSALVSELHEQEATLRAKLAKGEQWMKIVSEAIGDTRPALVRVLCDIPDLFEFPWQLLAESRRRYYNHRDPERLPLLIDLGE